MSDDAASVKNAMSHAARQKIGGREEFASDPSATWRRRADEAAMPFDAGACCLSEASSRAKDGVCLFTFEEPVFSDSSFTPNASTSSDSAAGMAASRKTVRRLSPIQPDEPRRDERAQHGARVVEPAVKAEGRAAALGGRRVRDHGVARRGADALPDAVHETDEDDRRPARGEADDGAGDGRQAVAEEDERLLGLRAVGEADPR